MRTRSSGGGDVDAVLYHAGAIGVRVDLDGAADDGRPREKDRVGSDVEALYGSSGADHMTGGPANDLLDGLGGDDTLVGGAGFDDLVGGAGADTCDGGPDGANEVGCEA